MEDMEMLRRSALAAGLDVMFFKDCPRIRPSSGDTTNTFIPWRPLEDDGDAMRLAVGLGISVVQHAHSVSASVPRNAGEQAARLEFSDGMRMASTRRVIVMAAARSKTPN